VGHWQTLFWQVRPPVHVMPHMPQWLLAVTVFTQVSLHNVSPPLQPHMALMHGRPPVHAMLHPPQCMALLVLLISQPFGPSPSQLAFVEEQVGVQVPATHSFPGEPVVPVGTQTLPQTPQSPSSLRKSDSQFMGFESQSPKFGKH
jgi:hypothetical protein